MSDTTGSGTRKKWVSIITSYSLFLIGLFLMSMGIAMIASSGLGTTPISSVNYVLSLILPLSFGTITFIMALLYIVLQFFIYRSHFRLRDLSQVLVAPLLGVFIDLGMYIFSLLHPETYLFRFGMLIAGCLILGFGTVVMVTPNVIINPMEGGIKAIAWKTGKEFGFIKIVNDAVLALTALIISLIAFHGIRGLREGTLISAFLVGFSIRYFFRLVKRKEKKDEGAGQGE